MDEKSIMLDRRGFVSLGACASLSALVSGCTNGRCGQSLRSPCVRFGVISDTHVTGEESAERLRLALGFFAQEKVDAVLHCGDVTNLGYRSEYAAFRKVWDSVMPGSTALVAALGNRDLSDTNKMPEDVRRRDAGLLIAFSPAGRAAGIHLHEVRGVPVIVLDWGFEDGLERFMSERPSLRRLNRPLLVVQHRHMAGTVYNASPGGWMADAGKGGCYLRMFPNAISFSGHSHVSFPEPNGVWHGDFTAASAGSCYVGPDGAPGAYEVSVLELGSEGFSLQRRDLKTGYSESHAYAWPARKEAFAGCSAGTFTFAQWNLGHFAHGKATSTSIAAADGEGRSRAYRALLECIRPDVLGLCEYSAVFDAGGRRTRTELFGDYGGFVAGPACGFQSNAIASRAPIADVKYVEFSKRKQKTYYALAVTEVCGVPVTVVETHLDLSREERQQQIAELVAAVEGRERVILSGDFNVDDLGEYSPLRKAGLAPANGGAFGVFNTHRRRRMEITPAIDNVLVRGLTICAVQTADDEFEFSDHRMLVVRIGLDEKASKPIVK